MIPCLGSGCRPTNQFYGYNKPRSVRALETWFRASHYATFFGRQNTPTELIRERVFIKSLIYGGEDPLGFSLNVYEFEERRGMEY